MAVLRRGNLVRAAGAVVWRVGRGGREVLLIHRPRYDDWSLPKGKVEGDESDEECARREVVEEVGVHGELGPELASTRYTDSRGRPKLVRYWAMRAADGEGLPGDGVDEVAWLPVGTARRRLTQPHDRRVLDSFAEALA